MNLARSLERRIEQLVEGVGSRVFPGRLHPTEVAIKMVREAELALTESGVGPTAPNHFTATLNPSDLGGDADSVVRRLAQLVDDMAGERGWRVEGPAAGVFQTSPAVGPRSTRVQGEGRGGPLEPWAQLIEIHGPRRLPGTRNPALVCRARRADVVLGDDSVSRTHALLWYDSGGVWVRDLASSNGTTINGTFIDDAEGVHPGDVLGFGTARFSFRRS